MNELATLQPVEYGVPLSSQQLRSRLAIIQDVMRHVMQPDVDYGVIPGTDKPTLFKPGAEKLCVTFRLSAGSPLIEAVPELTGAIRYRVQVPIIASDGTVLAVGVGECSTSEEKYAWRRPVHENEFKAAHDDQKREKWARNGDVWLQVRVNPSDVANTVLKMAHKRGYVHGVIMATAAGAIFTQDVEDLPEGVDPNGEAAPRQQPIRQPQRKSQASAPAGAGSVVTVTVRDVTEKQGQGDKGPWTKFTILAGDGKAYGTFDTEIARVAREAKQARAEVEITFTDGKFGRDAKGIGYPAPATATAERQPGEDG